MTTEKQKQATRRRPDGRIEWTNAVDPDGVLVDLTVYDVERSGSEAAVLDYQRRRREQIEARLAEVEEQGRFEDFREAFIASGGARSDARAAYRDMRNRQAAEAAENADLSAARATRARIGSRL